MGEKQLSDLTVKQDSYTEDILEILKFVKPSWKREDIEIEVLSGGYSCLMCKCYNKNDAEDAITIRARNKLGYLPIIDHLFEHKVLKIMSELSYFPKIVGIFKNGYCYTYIKGTPVHKMPSYVLKTSERQLRCIARKMADIHNVKVVDVDYSKANYFRTLGKCLEEFYPRNEQKLPEYEDLKRTLDFLEKKISNKGYTVGLCHGDPHVGNIVWNEEDESVTFVDWEVTYIGYQMCDLAYFLFFIDKHGFQIVNEQPDNFTRKFLRYYLERVAENDGRSSAEVTDSDVDNVEKQIPVFKMVISVYLSIVLGCTFDKYQEKLETDPIVGIDYKGAIIREAAVLEAVAGYIYQMIMHEDNAHVEIEMWC